MVDIKVIYHEVVWRVISRLHCVQPECPKETGEMTADGLDSIHPGDRTLSWWRDIKRTSYITPPASLSATSVCISAAVFIVVMTARSSSFPSKGTLRALSGRIRSNQFSSLQILRTVINNDLTEEYIGRLQNSITTVWSYYCDFLRDYMLA